MVGRELLLDGAGQVAVVLGWKSVTHPPWAPPFMMFIMGTGRVVAAIRTLEKGLAD